MDLKAKIRTVPHWPIEGVMFRDITSLLQDPVAYRYVCQQFIERYQDMQIDKVVGIDARGFIFAAVLAQQLNIGMVPVRKKGKLPAATISHEYELEYGSSTLEIHQDAIAQHDKVLIVDDLLATGGTAAAAVKLVEQLGGNVVEVSFVIELPDLKGRQQLNGHSIYSLVEFAGE